MFYLLRIFWRRIDNSRMLPQLYVEFYLPRSNEKLIKSVKVVYMYIREKRWEGDSAFPCVGDNFKLKDRTWQLKQL